MEKTVNHFFEGLNTDRFDGMRSQNCLLQNEGFRILDVKGHGLINIQMLGNDYDETAGKERGYKITNGFTIVGEFVYKGVAFIFSQNTAANQFEIGTFPSPDHVNGGYLPFYRPLQNYTGANNPLVYQQQNQQNDAAYQAALLPFRQNFRISNASAYPWNIGERMIQVTGRMNFDNSVNLYLADGENPLKVINCGFNIFTGLFTKRAYSDLMFKHAVHVFNETDFPVLLYDNGIDKREVEIGYAGRFKCGNVQFYFRYSDEDFNATSYQSHSGMVSIIPSNEQTTSNGHTFTGGAGDKETNKSVKLFIQLLNASGQNFIDHAYKYLEIAYIRHFENGSMESFRIDKRWEIQDLIANRGANDYYEVEVTNFEPLIATPAAEIIRTKRRDVIPLDVTTVEDRLWAGNVKVADENNNVLYEFAQSITMAPIKRRLKDKAAPVDPAITSVGLADIGYKSYQNVYHYAHYFSGEVYAIGVQYLLRTTGTWSESFPIEGADWYTGAKQNVNTKGIIRFPSMKARPVIIENVLDEFDINGIEFTVPATNFTDTQGANLTDYCTALRFTRVERKKNLLYQGLICKAFCSHNELAWGNYAAVQGFMRPGLWQHFPYAYNQDGATVVGGTLYPKRTDGSAYSFLSNTRSFPSPFSISVEDTQFNGALFHGIDTRPGTQGWRDMYDPYQFVPGAHEPYPIIGGITGMTLGSRHWLRCDVPFKLFVYTRDSEQDGHSLLHWTKLRFVNTAPPSTNNVTTPNYDTLDGMIFHDADNSPTGQAFRGLSFRGDFEGWHRGPVNTIPGWSRGYWGIYSLDYAIQKNLNETNYYIKKIGEESPWVNASRAPANKIYRANVGSVYGHNPNAEVYAMNRILLDFETFRVNTGGRISGFDKPSRWTGGVYDDTQVYIGALSRIEPWQVMPNKVFCSYFKEGSGDVTSATDVGTDGDDSSDEQIEANQNQIYVQRKNSDFHFYHFSQRNAKGGAKNGKLDIDNLEFAVGPYIGVDFTGLGGPYEQPMFWHNDLVAVYYRNPDDPNFDITSWYNPASEKYFPITRHHYLTNDLNLVAPTTKQAYRGDSFPSHAYIKVLTNPIYNPYGRDDDYDSYVGRGKGHPGFGQLLGYVAEHGVNTGFRHPEDIATANLVEELDYESFYPAVEPQTPFTYAMLNRGRESFRYNDGYTKQLSLAVSAGFDIQIPFREKHYQCRIIYSSKQTDEGIIDNWRDISIASYRDFEGAHGALVRVIGKANKLYSIYEGGIKSHPINELVQQATSAGNMVVGVQSDVLPSISGSISDTYGAQGTRAVGVSDYFIYGLDFNKRSIWQLPVGGGAVKIISVTEECTKLLHDVIEDPQQFSDARYQIENLPTFSNGISMGYNRKYKEFYFSLRKNLRNRVIVFNEVLGKFSGHLEIFVPWFTTINEDFYGWDYDNIQNIDKKFWLWDQEKTNAGLDNSGTFFGQARNTWFEVVASPASSIEKVWDCIHAQMNKVDISSVFINTQEQSTVHFPFNQAATPRYIKPTYREDKWEFAIKRADGVDPNSHYRIGSIMRGNHLRVKFTFNSQRNIFVKSMITGYRISNH